MKSILNKTALTVAVITMLSACGLYDNLDTEPQQSLSNTTAITTPVDAESALNGTYAAMNQDGYYARMHVVLGPNQFIYLGSTASTTRSITFDSENNNVSPADNTLTATWDDIYEMADRASNVIEAVPNIDESAFSPASRKNEIIAEARFLRALAHFDALRFFGRFWDNSSALGAPLRLVPGNTTNKDLARSSVAETYTSINEDLDFAIANGPNFSVSHLTSVAAARALKARVALYQGDFETAASLATQVIDDGNFGLEAVYDDIFINRLGSSELIFGMFANATTEQSSHSFFFLSQASGGRQDYGPTAQFLSLIDGDPREGASVDASVPEVLKYPNVNTQDDPAYIMRLAELYFIRAEARARQATPDLAGALADLNVIRARVGLPDATASTVDEFLDQMQEEKVKELAFEGSHSWFDAIRLGNARTLKSSIPSDDRLVLPLPTQEIDNNDLLDQNPSY